MKGFYSLMYKKIVIKQPNFWNKSLHLSYRSSDLEIKLHRFKQVKGGIRPLFITLGNDTVLKFYKTLAVPKLLYEFQVL